MDRLRAMTVFVHVAEEGGFAAAARRLGLSPASATRAVSELEARLGVRLLHRTTRSLRLTRTGERYLADCREILARVENADRQAAGAQAEPGGRVVVSASVLFGRMVVTPILLELLDRYPLMSFSALFVDRIVHLLDEGVDIAVRIAELPDSSLAAVRVGGLRRLLCASPDYLDARGRPRTPAQLTDHDLIDFTPLTTSGDGVFEGGGGRGARPRSRFQVNNADAAIAAALDGRGITRVLSYMVEAHLAQGRLEVVLADREPPVVPVHVVHKEAGRTSAPVRVVVDHLVERLRAEPALRF